MSTANDRRELLQLARGRLDEWLYVAREEAHSDLFEGEDAILDAEELALLDRLDEDLTEWTGEGLWGADEYGIVETGAVNGEAGLRVVCTAHPQIPYEGYRGAESVDESTREELNDVVWEFCERVAENAQAELDRFVVAARNGNLDDERAGSER